MIYKTLSLKLKDIDLEVRKSFYIFAKKEKHHEYIFGRIQL